MKASPTRAASTDLGSTVPATLGALESALCDIFGFTANVDITASPFSFDNSGHITKQLVLQKAAGPVGWRFRNSDSNKEMRICVNGTNLDFDENTGSEAIPVWVNRFRIAVSTGALTGSTFSTSTAGLAPASDGNATKFLCADGTYKVPSSALATSCGLTNSTTQNISNATFTAISFDTENFDNGGMHSGANPTRITFPSAGKYLVSGMSGFSSGGSADTRRVIDIWQNGVGSSPQGRGEVQVSAVGQAYPSVVALINAAANDYVELVAWQNSGATLTTIQSGLSVPQFSAYKIGG